MRFSKNLYPKNITKAGIRGESVDEQPSPFILFIARDHYYANSYFNSIEENEKFVAGAPEQVLIMERKKESDALNKISVLSQKISELN